MSNHARPSLFHSFANYTARGAGHPATFTAAVLVILGWAVVMGPLFHYSDTWQLVIEHGHHHRDLPDGVPDPEYPEPGIKGGATQAG